MKIINALKTKVANKSFGVAFIATSISSVIRIGSLFLLNKVLAVSLGPSGYTLFGQFLNFFAITTSVSSAGLANGVTSQTAKFSSKRKYLLIFSVRCLLIILFFTFITQLIIFFNAPYILKALNIDSEYINLIYFFSFSIPFFSLNIFLLSFISGLQKYILYAFINSISAIVTLILSLILIKDGDLSGPIYAIYLTQFFLFLFNISFLVNFFKKEIDIKNIQITNMLPSKRLLSTLSQFSIMVIFGSILANFNEIYLRNLLILYLDKTQAGIWDSIIRLSSYYLIPFTVLMPIYFIPEFSKLKKSNLNSFLVSSLYQAFLILIPISIFIYVFIEKIIFLALSPEFIQIKEFIGLFLLSDIFRMISYLLMHFFIAKKLTWQYILLESFITILGILIFTFIGITSLESFAEMRMYLYLFSSLLIIFIIVGKYPNKRRLMNWGHVDEI
tara:strand:+ start:265 stop:1599 length:1335 start_codon:yes stop_codon:yes gene_type:complete